MENRHYDIHGADNPHSIILVHGLGVTRKWWHPQISTLSDEFRVIAMDLPGHGTMSEYPFKFEAALEHLNSVLDKEVSTSALLVGISLGGYLAAAYADRFRGRVAGLVLCGSSINMSGLQGLAFRMTGFMIKRKGPDWLREGTIKGYRKRVAATLIEPVIDAGIFLNTAADTFFQLSGRNFHRMLKNYPGPLLIVNGEEDEPNRGAEKSLLKYAPGARSVPIHAASHLTNLEQPEAFNNAVRTFAHGISW